MKKQDALKVIVECAKLYKQNLVNKDLMFITIVNQNKFSFLEVKFLKRNYLHLTGVVLTSEKLNAKLFYNKCIGGKLSINDFELKKDGTTTLKLSILPQLMNLHNTTKMIGDFYSSKPKLYAEKVAGNVVGCIGFIKNKSTYIPNTTLKEDIRSIILNKERVIAIFTKNITDKFYNNLTYLVKDYNDINFLPQKIINKIDIGNLYIDDNIIKRIRDIEKDTLQQIALGNNKANPNTH